jgi:hypothetical protein
MMNAMEFHHEVTYDATAAEVFAMLADRAFREHSSPGADPSVSITPSGEGEGMNVRVEAVRPTTGVPAFAQRFAGESMHSVRTEIWRTAREAVLSIETPGRPASINGTLRLVEADCVTTETMDAVIEVAVPLIGDRLESLMADLVAAGMEDEHAAGAAWLKGER